MPCLWPFWRRASCWTKRHPNSSPQCARKRAAHIPTISWWAPCPPPPRHARYAHTNPPHAPGHGKCPFWQTYWLGCGRYSGRKTQAQCPSLSWRSILKSTRHAHCLRHPRLSFRDTHYHWKRGPEYYAWHYALFRNWSSRAHTTQPKSERVPRCQCRPVGRLNRRPYFACRDTMHKHVQLLTSYCDSTWTLRTHTRTNAHKSYEYRRRKTEHEVEEARLQRALTGNLNTGLMPSSLCAKGGAGATNFAGDYYPVMGGGKSRPSPIHVHTQESAATDGPGHV